MQRFWDILRDPMVDAAQPKVMIKLNNVPGASSIINIDVILINSRNQARMKLSSLLNRNHFWRRFRLDLHTSWKSLNVSRLRL